MHIQGVFKGAAGIHILAREKLGALRVSPIHQKPVIYERAPPTTRTGFVQGRERSAMNTTLLTVKTPRRSERKIYLGYEVIHHV